MLYGRGGTNPLILDLRTTQKKGSHGTEWVEVEVKKKYLFYWGSKSEQLAPYPVNLLTAVRPHQS
jgi:hypothetical protein